MQESSNGSYQENSGANSRVVGVSANSSLSSLKREIFRTFSDIPRLATAKKSTDTDR